MRKRKKTIGHYDLFSSPKRAMESSACAEGENVELRSVVLRAQRSTSIRGAQRTRETKISEKNRRRACVLILLMRLRIAL